LQPGAKQRIVFLSRAKVEIRHYLVEALARCTLGGANTLRAKGKEMFMARCEVCGNEYDKAFEVILSGKKHIFDCFECAIHALAPVCAHCHCHVIGHGVEAAGNIYCCANCASLHGVRGMKDRLESPMAAAA
jgi:hypothetical protein